MGACLRPSAASLVLSALTLAAKVRSSTKYPGQRSRSAGRWAAAVRAASRQRRARRRCRCWRGCRGARRQSWRRRRSPWASAFATLGSALPAARRAPCAPSCTAAGAYAMYTSSDEGLGGFAWNYRRTPSQRASLTRAPPAATCGWVITHLLFHVEPDGEVRLAEGALGGQRHRFRGPSAQGLVGQGTTSAAHLAGLDGDCHRGGHLRGGQGSAVASSQGGASAMRLPTLSSPRSSQRPDCPPAHAALSVSTRAKTAVHASADRAANLDVVEQPLEALGDRGIVPAGAGTSAQELGSAAGQRSADTAHSRPETSVSAQVPAKRPVGADGGGTRRAHHPC